MAWKFRYSIARRVVDYVVTWLLQSALAPKGLYLLTVPGRKSGMPHSTPVALVEDGPERWLVAPYGEVEWVKNARVAGSVSLARGRKSEVLLITEVSAEKSVPVLKKYLTQYPITRPYFDAKLKSSQSEFIKEASSHPVFELHKAQHESKLQ